jgi:hypothetical protein
MVLTVHVHASVHPSPPAALSLPPFLPTSLLVLECTHACACACVSGIHPCFVLYLRVGDRPFRARKVRIARECPCKAAQTRECVLLCRTSRQCYVS